MLKLAVSGPAVAATMRAYLDQIAVVLRPGSVDNADLCLRSLRSFLLGRTLVGCRARTNPLEQTKVTLHESDRSGDVI